MAVSSGAMVNYWAHDHAIVGSLLTGSGHVAEIYESCLCCVDTNCTAMSLKSAFDRIHLAKGSYINVGFITLIYTIMKIVDNKFLKNNSTFR